MGHPPSSVRRPLAIRVPITAALALLLGALAMVIAAPAASAHGDAGRITVLASQPTGPLAVQVEVGIVHANDGDPAEEATVSAILTGPDGAQVGPVPLPNLRSARYGATVAVPAPGAWTIAVTSTEPAGTASATAEVPGTPPTTVVPTTTTPVTVVVATTTGAAVVPVSGDGSSDGSGNGALTAGLAAAVFLAALGAGYAVGRRRFAER